MKLEPPDAVLFWELLYTCRLCGKTFPKKYITFDDPSNQPDITPENAWGHHWASAHRALRELEHATATHKCGGDSRAVGVGDLSGITPLWEEPDPERSQYWVSGV